MSVVRTDTCEVLKDTPNLIVMPVSSQAVGGLAEREDKDTLRWLMIGTLFRTPKSLTAD